MTSVVLLTGGSTPERDVAFAGAAQVLRALRERRYSVTVVDTVFGPLSRADERRFVEQAVGRTHPTMDELRALAEREHLDTLVQLSELREADLVFLVLHGLQGEGGEIQRLLELAHVAYTGSGPEASALAMDKDAAKRQFRAAGIPTPSWRMWPAEEEAVAELGFPLIVKPSKVGSSVGLTIVRSHDAVESAVQFAALYDDEVMLEQLLEGREFTVGVLGERALAVGEIIPSHATFDYECKYTPGMTEEIFPAEIPAELAQRLQALALKAHQALELRDFSRVDFKLDSTGIPLCLEVNTLPGLTHTSLLPQSAAAAGVSFGDLCEAICSAVANRGRHKEQSRVLRH